MDEQIKKAIEEYQCPGCVAGSNTYCGEYEQQDNHSLDVSCQEHVCGTMASHVGRFFLGMPIGFCRLGFCDKTKIHIFKTLSDGWGYDKFNYPVWKYLDEHGNTLVRGICPRANYPWIHIFLENCLDKIDCLEITQTDINEMD